MRGWRLREPISGRREPGRSSRPATAGGRGGNSAVAYFFGRGLQRRLQAPIGLIQDAVGGVPAETYTSPDALRPLKGYDAGIAEVERRRAMGSPEYGNCILHWYDTTNSILARRMVPGPIRRSTIRNGRPSGFRIRKPRF